MSTQQPVDPLVEAAGRWQRAADAMREEAERLRAERDQADQEAQVTIPEATRE